jgi:hypothetical protein
MSGSGVRTQLFAGQGVCNIWTLTIGRSPLLKTFLFGSCFLQSLLFNVISPLLPSACSLIDVVLCPLPITCGPANLCLSGVSPTTCATLGSNTSVCLQLTHIAQKLSITLSFIIYKHFTAPSTRTPTLLPTLRPSSFPSARPSKRPSSAPSTCVCVRKRERVYVCVCVCVCVRVCLGYPR